jgi:D-alanyl-D-alanine carboxypeptidase
MARLPEFKTMNMMRKTTLLLLLAVLPSSSGIPSRAQNDAVDEYIKSEMSRRGIPGLSLAVVKEGKIVKQKGYGVASVELNVPITNGSVYALFSTSKIFTGTAVMRLIEEGKLKLDDSICDWLPSAPAVWKLVTVRHLLTQTSGLPDITADGMSGALLAASRDELLQKLVGLPVISRPGDKWNYIQTNSFLLQVIIERVAGMKFEEFMAQRFFLQMGMASTRYGDSSEVVRGRAPVYTFRLGDRLRTRQFNFPPFVYAGAGLNSTLGDLVKWESALQGGRLLKPSSLEALWTPARLNDGSSVFDFDGRSSYGLHWAISPEGERKVVGHPGNDAVTIARFLDEKLTIILLTNLAGAGPSSLAAGVVTRYHTSAQSRK